MPLNTECTQVSWAVLVPPAEQCLFIWPYGSTDILKGYICAGDISNNQDVARSLVLKAFEMGVQYGSKSGAN